VIRLCCFFGVTRQAYYKGLKQRECEAVQEELIIKLVQQVRRNNKKMGGKKLYWLLQTDIHRIDASMGRDKFFFLLRQWGLLVQRRRKYAITTESYHRFRVYTNKLLDFTPERPHHAWVCDITYVRIKKGFVYLFLITDAYSRKIVGWELSSSLGLGGALQSLGMAIRQCPCAKGLIHHSDRGFQYCSHEYVARLKAKGIEISMAEAGNCYENAMAERVNGILKDEYGLDETFTDEREARHCVREGIKAYNEQRPHWSLKLQIPAVVHELGNRRIVEKSVNFY
jgi:transposase InsO family protein